MAWRRVSIYHGDETLQALVHETRTRDGQPGPALLITHPYGPLGGNAWNNVVQSIATAFIPGYTILCLNLRGCGGSSGRTSWTGHPEITDVGAGITYLLNILSVSSIVLVGYSYGTAVVLPHLNHAAVKGCVCVSMPTRVLWALCWNHRTWEILEETRKPVLQVVGSRDVLLCDVRRICGLASLEWVQVALVEGADHFWVGMEKEVARAMAEFLDQCWEVEKGRRENAE